MPPRPSRAKKKPVVDDTIPVEDEVPVEAPEVYAASDALGPDDAIPVESEVPVEPLTAAEADILHEAVSVGVETDEPPIDPADWPEDEPEGIVSHGMTVRDPETAAALDEILTEAALRSLRSDVRPEPGKHYVIFGGKPVPVTRAFAQTEDEFVRAQLNVSDELRDHDGNRIARADRTLRMRYRGYVCGEMSSL